MKTRLTKILISGAIAVTFPLAARGDIFPEPTDVPTGTTIAIDGSSSLAIANQALKERFEKRYPGAKVNINYGGSDNALQALENGSIDIATIGRPLTEAERAEGFKTIALPRRKIAIVVSPENPFRGTLSDRQFAAIVRGEITDWSALGREGGRIQLIDRDRGDTRQAFANYPAFRSTFQPGGDSVRVEEDSTAAVAGKLGKDGISYTIADQAVNNPNLRVLTMFNTPVTDPRYPFSQPRYLVYKDANRPGVRYFLGFVNSSDGKAAIESATAGGETAWSAGRTTGTTVTESPTVIESPTTTANAVPAAESETGASPWWWLLLPLALLGGLGLWWKNRRSPKETIEPDIPRPIAPPPPVIPEENKRVVISPEPDPVSDFLESLIDPDLDTELGGIDRRTIPDYPFPEIDRSTVADHPFPAADRETMTDYPFPVSPVDDTTVPDFLRQGIDRGAPMSFDDTVLDLPFLDDEDGVEFPSGLSSGIVPPLVGLPETVPPPENVEFIEADARSHCYELDDLRLLDLEKRSNCITLDPGTYRIKITDGFFRYGADERFPEGEPLVLLWIFGGRFINLQTNVEVEQTWVSLNGYEDELILRAIEPTRICGLFFDTYADDNAGQIELAIHQL